MAIFPLIAILFWGSIFFFGFRSAFVQEKGPLIQPMRTVLKSLGDAVWILIGILICGVILLVVLDVGQIAAHRSPVGFFTTMAFFCLIPADALLAAKLFLPKE
ncbi:MAG TPA: hypothetical protein PK014_01170 [Thermoanaerobaculia bacterium]|nr:hypothetical protein [Thermoanaerobaculia bacterium]HUM29781.1 hypothetical protein [Thermoanaerobaculia bacterium]HXK67081.1 hypothetical protein [Thermoanaerobaculia bacterium]